MFGLVRAAVLGFFLLTAVYVMVSIYSRSVRRESLEKSWDSDPAREGLAVADRDSFIEAGMAEYKHGLRRRLIVLVYIIPAVTFCVIVYIVNAQ